MLVGWIVTTASLFSKSVKKKQNNLLFLKKMVINIKENS